ncbi:uncharacterized protein LOC108732371 [Agrilus planipennis]|uniref:Uncharacterized protein LOC108732371 n=1 Tax=Agrilus planipennis TaxID=224129 RepID=A0A1W4WF61_AGRPL|nr:uncharacterized protein LOC108732371 [Agrilus planipennis]
MLELLEKSLRSVSLYAPVGYISQTCNSMFSVTFINEKTDTPHNFFPNMQNCVQRSQPQHPQKKGEDFLKIASNVVHDFFNHDTYTVPNRTVFMVNTNKHVLDVVEAKVEGIRNSITKFERHKPALMHNTSKIAHRYNLLLSFNHAKDVRNVDPSLHSSKTNQHQYLVLSKSRNLVTMNQKILLGSIPFLTFVRFSKDQVPAEKQTSPDKDQIKKSESNTQIISKGTDKKTDENKKLNTKSKKESKGTLSLLKDVLLFFSKPPKLMLKSKPSTVVSNLPKKKATDNLVKTEDTSTNAQMVRKQSTFSDIHENKNEFEIPERQWAIEIKPDISKIPADKPSTKTNASETNLESDIEKSSQQAEIFKEETYKVRSIEYSPYKQRKFEKVPNKLARNTVVFSRNPEQVVKPVGLTSYFFGKKLKGLSILRSFKKKKLHTMPLISQPMLRLVEADVFINSQNVCFSNTNILLFKKEEKEEEEEEEEEEVAEVESPYAISYDAETAFETEEVESAEEAEESDAEEAEETTTVKKTETDIGLGNKFDYNEDDSVNKDIEIDETSTSKFSGIQPDLDTLVCDLTMAIQPVEGIVGQLRNIWKTFGYLYGMDILACQYQCDFANQTTVLINIHRNLSSGIKKLTAGEIGNNDGLVNVKQYSTCSDGNEPPTAEYRDGIFADLPYILVCDPEYEEKVSKRAGSEYKSPQYFLYHCYSFYDFFNYLALCRVGSGPCCCC